MNKKENIKNSGKVGSNDKKESMDLKLNLNLLDFVKEFKECKKEGIELENMYLDIVGVKSVKNYDRVYKRSLREELKDVLVEELKERELSIEEYISLGNEVKEKIRSVKVLNYRMVKK